MQRKVNAIMTKRAVWIFALLCLIAAAGAARPAKHQHIVRTQWTVRETAGPQATTISVPDGLTAQVRELQGLASAPVPLDMTGRDVALVALGGYLVNSICLECHTLNPWLAGGNPYLGQPKKVNTVNYLAGGAVFGPFTSRNLTPEPDNDNKPAGMDLEEFKHVMRTGEDLDKLHPQMGPLLQVMPWPQFQIFTDRDLEAMHEYLSAVPPVAKPTP